MTTNPKATDSLSAASIPTEKKDPASDAELLDDADAAWIKSVKEKEVAAENPDTTKNKEKTKKEKTPAVPLHRLFRFANKYDWIMITLAFICSVFSGAIQPVTVIIFGDFLNNLSLTLSTPSDILNQTKVAILVLVYLGTATLVAAYFSNCFWIIAGENQTRRIRLLYLHAIMRQEITWFDKAEEGSLNSRLAADTQIIQDGISEKFGMFVMCFAQFISGYIVAFVKGWRLAVIVLATVPLLMIIGGAIGILITRYTKKVQDSYADAGTVAEQVFAGLRTVYSFSLQNRFSQLYQARLKKARATGISRGIALGLGFGAFMLTLLATYGLSFWYGSRLVKEGHMNGPTVLVVFMSMMMGSMAILQLPPNLSAVSSACGAAYNIYATIDNIPTIDSDSNEGLQLETIHGDITFENVDFSYPTRPDIPILQRFSVKIRPGSTVAFVGSSGSGKSTSIQLLQRFYDTKSGQILLDGHDIKTLNVRWLRQQIGVVGQEPVLFNMTIRQNLLMGVADPSTVTDEDIISACKQANCHSFITQLPKGYHTLVGEQGGMLSGGQKQRVAIARAILKNPSILLLDEATSALDTQSERLVQHALDAASVNRTTIVIAHRLSTIRNADLIVVMDHGEVIEQGTHKELIEKDGFYAGLVKKQQISTIKDGVDQTTLKEAEELDADQLLLQEQTEIQLELADRQERENWAPNRRTSTTTSADAFELKIQKEKADRKQKMKESAPIFKVLREMRPEWPLMAVGCLCSAIAGAVFPCFAYALSQVIVMITDPSKFDQIDAGPVRGTNLYAFLFLMIGIAAFIGFGFQVISFEIAGERYTYRLRSNIFRAYMKQEVGFFDEEDNNLGALTTKLAVDAKNVNELVTKVWGDFIQTIFTGIVGLIIAFVHSWLLTLIILCMTPFIVVAAGYETRVHRGFADKTKKANAQSGEVAGEAIKEIRTVVSLGKQSYFEDRYAKAIERPHRLAIRKAVFASIGHGMFRGFSLYANAVAFYAGVRLIMDGRINFPDMFITMMAILITATNVGNGSVFISTYAKAKYSAIASFEVLERHPKIDPELEGIEPEAVHGDVKFENISFNYPARPDIPIFSGDFNIHANVNQSIALVGASGCGKSTTVGMLLRWYDPNGGAVRLDEQNIKSYTLANLRGHMAWVGQEPVLFDMTIGENIRFGVESDKHVSQEQIEEACRAANIHSFIKNLPKGYDTRVGDKGSQLSGGQKQRLAIARAWIRKPKVLLLDEATSALDSDSEKLVQAALDNVISEGGRTTITIAHRLSTIQNSDLICVIKNGRVIEQGTHWELLRLNGTYSELVSQQSLTVS